MTSICKILVDSLTTLELKLTSVLALDDGLPHGSKAEYYALKGKIQEILHNFTFLLPLSDCLNEWIVDKNKNLQSLAIQIQKTVEEAAEKVRPEDVDNVWREICEMTNEREPQAVQNPLLFWVKRQTNTPRRALLFDVLSQVNAKIHLLKPKIEKKWSEIMGCSLFTSQTACCKLFNCKFGFEWLISSACSCLSEIDPESIGSEYQNVLLKLKGNLSDLQIFFHGISELQPFLHGIYEEITGEVARLAIRTLLLACRWWVRVYQGFTGRYDNVFDNGICYVLKSISSDNPETLGLVLRLLKSLKAIDHSLFSRKVIEFAHYIIPNLIGIDLLTREIGSSTITISLQVLVEPKELKSILILLPLMDQIFEMKNSFSLWLPEDEPLMLNLVANACLMRIEAVFTYLIRYRGRFRYPFKTSGKWTFQFSQEWPEESRENIDEILKFLYEVALLQETPDYCFPCPEAVWEFSVLLKVQFLKLKRELESCNGISKFSLKDKVQSLQDWSEFLINFFVRYRNNSEHYKKAWRKYEVGIESMVKTVVSSCNSFLNHHYISDEMLQSVDHIFSSLLDDTTNIMAGIVEELCLPVRISNLPKTNTLGFYDILLGKVHELMNFKATLFFSLKQYMTRK